MYREAGACISTSSSPHKITHHDGGVQVDLFSLAEDREVLEMPIGGKPCRFDISFAAYSERLLELATCCRSGSIHLGT